MVEIEGRVGNGSYASLGSAVTLSSLDLSKDKLISISDSQLAVHPNYGQGKVLTLRGVLKDLAGNKKEVSPSSNTLIIDTVVPTASLSYTVGGSPVSRVKQGTEVLVSATLSEPIAVAPVLQITGSGSNTLSAVDMTRVSSTSYSYSWTVRVGDGNSDFVVSVGKDLAGNVILATPTSGGLIIVDNTAPSLFTTGVVSVSGGVV